MTEERNCENCGSVHCYTHEPKYQVCKEGSLWQPLKEKLSISEMHEYAHKLFDCFNELDFRTTYNKALQAFYLEEGLYVVRSESMGKYQYTLVIASSEEMAIRKCM